MNEAKAAFEYGIEERPSLVVFDKGIPSLYEKDDFKDANQILNWITGEVSGEDTVEAVTDSMLDMMIAKQRHVAAFFYNKQNQKSLKTLGKFYLSFNSFDNLIHNTGNIYCIGIYIIIMFLEMLETIDDDVSKLAPQVSFVKIDNEAVAKEYGLPTNEPSLVFFEDGLPKYVQILPCVDAFMLLHIFG